MTAAGAHGESCVCMYVGTCTYQAGMYALGMGAWMALSGPINAFSCRCRCSSSELRAAAAAARTMYSSVTFIYKSNDKSTKSQLKFKDECEPRNYQVSPTLAVSACPFFFFSISSFFSFFFFFFLFFFSYVPTRSIDYRGFPPLV